MAKSPMEVLAMAKKEMAQRDAGGETTIAAAAPPAASKLSPAEVLRLAQQQQRRQQEQQHAVSEQQRPLEPEPEPELPLPPLAPPVANLAEPEPEPEPQLLAPAPQVSGLNLSIESSGPNLSVEPAPPSPPAPELAGPHDAEPEALAKAKALYDFPAEQEGDLGFSAGDIIVLTEATQTWWQGYREEAGPPGGTFPSNYVELVPEEGRVQWARIVDREHKSAQASTPVSGSTPTPTLDDMDPRSGGGRLERRLSRRRSSASMLVDLELWLTLEVGNVQTGGTTRISRSMSQFVELQHQLSREFPGYSPSALEASMSSASLTKKSAESKQQLLQLMLDGLGVRALLRECDAVQRFLSPAFAGYGPPEIETIALVGGGTATVPKPGPVVAADEVCAKLSEVRRDGRVCTDEVFEQQRRRTHLEDFSGASLLDTDGGGWVDASGKSSPLDAAVPDGWSWVSEWKHDWFEEMTDAEGWNYALHFHAPTEQWRSQSDGSCLVRRRRWVRIRQQSLFGELTDEEQMEILLAERAGRMRVDKGSSLLTALEESLDEVVQANAQSELEEGLRRATDADIAAVADSEADGMLNLTAEHLEKVFTQFDPDTIAAVLEDFDGEPIIAAKRLASMLPGAEEAAALHKCGLGAMVAAQQQAKEEGEEEDIEAYLQRCFASAETAEVDYTMYDSKGEATDNPFDEDIDHSDRRAAYLGALCCLAGGKMQDVFSDVPAELTENDCKLLRDVLLVEPCTESGAPPVVATPRGPLSPASTTSPARRVTKEVDEATMQQHKNTLPVAFEMRSRMAEEFERQMYCMKTHPYYNVKSFPTPETYTGWRVREQMRLAMAIEHVQGMPRFEGQLTIKLRQVSGIHHDADELTSKQERAEYTCQLTVGGETKTSERLPVEEGGIVRWESEFTFNITEDPPPWVMLEVLEHGNTVKSISDVVENVGGAAVSVAGRMGGLASKTARFGGKKITGAAEMVGFSGLAPGLTTRVDDSSAGSKRPGREDGSEVVIGSTKLPSLDGMWCPPPHFKSHHDPLHGDDGLAGIVSYDLQYSYRRVQESTRDWSEESLFEGIGASMESIHKDAHKIFRVLVRSLARAEDGDSDGGMGSGMTLMEPIGWLFDQFCELFGVGEPYRRLFELRVLLATFKPTAGCLGQVSVALNEMRALEKREIAEWTQDERDLEARIVLHLQETLSRCFIMYKTVFPHGSVQNGALSLAAHVFSLVMEDSDDVMRSLVMQHADRLVDIILQGSDLDGSIVKPRVLSCLLFELRRDLKEDVDHYRSVFPDGVQLVDTHCSQYAGEESRVRSAILNCVSNMSEQQRDQDDALVMFDDADALFDLVADVSPETQLLDLKSVFSPILELHIASFKARMMVWASRAGRSDDCAMVSESETPRVRRHDDEEDEEEDETQAGLHSHGIDDLFGFCLRGLRRLVEMGTQETAFSIFCDVMTNYCDTVVQQCEQIMKDASPIRSENEASKASEQVAEIAKTSFGFLKKMGRAAEAMVDQRSIAAAFDGAASDDDDDDELGSAVQFTVPKEFWVRLNNLWVLSESRVQPIGVDASELFDELVDGDSQLQQIIEERVVEFVTRVRRQVGELVRRLVGKTQPAIRADIRAALDRHCKVQHLDATEIWKPVFDSLDSVLLGPHETLYNSMFQRLMRQMCTAFFEHIEDFLAGVVLLKGRNTPIEMLDHGIEISKDYWAGGGVSESRLQRITGTDTALTRYLGLHAESTADLKAMYYSIVDEARSLSGYSMGDQVAEVAGVLQTRGAEPEAVSFVVEIGAAAHGRVPAFLGLEETEELHAKTTCRHNLSGTLYVTDGFLCFEPKAENGLDGLDREIRDKEEAESRIKADIREITYILKEKGAAGRETVLEIGTVGDETYTLQGFRKKALRDDVYQRICTRASTFGKRLDVMDDEAWAKYRRMFGLSSSENLVNSFRCSIPHLEQYSFGAAKGAVANGRLYISTSFLCFRETSGSADRRFKFVLPFSGIVEAEAKADATFGAVLPNTVEITTQEGECYTMTSFNMVSRDTAYLLIQQKIDACKGQPVLMLPDGLSSGAATAATSTIIIHREEGGFGMEIDEAGLVTGFAGPDTPAEQAGVPLGSRITGVENTLVTTREEILTILGTTRNTDVVFDFAMTSVTPPQQTAAAATAAAGPGSPPPIHYGSSPYTISFFTSSHEGALQGFPPRVTSTTAGFCWRFA